MSKLPTVYLASGQAVKLNAAMAFFDKVIVCKVSSDVSEQPFGDEETMKGMYQRASKISRVPVLSIETGLVERKSGYLDRSYGLLRTNLGDFVEHVDYEIKQELPQLEEWLKLTNRSNVTLGSLVNQTNSNDWYSGVTRAELLTKLVGKLVDCYLNELYALSVKSLPMKLASHNGVSFIDLQHTLLKEPTKLIKCISELSKGLLYNKVMLLEARGFIFAGVFDETPMILARKPGKLPGEEITVEYVKEYGTDKLCIQTGLIQPGDHVLVVDDVIATGGTMHACSELISKCGGIVAGYVAPFIVTKNQEFLCDGPILRQSRWLCTSEDANYTQTLAQIAKNTIKPRDNVIRIFGETLMYYERSDVLIWDKFRRSSNIMFDGPSMKGKHVQIFIDTADYKSTFDLLQLLTIIRRKEPASVTVVLPGIEHGTQDRIEYKDRYETLAQIDTIGKLFGEFKVITFDIHALQSQFTFFHLENYSLVEKLYQLYSDRHESTVVFPDAGAAKRFADVLHLKDYIVFDKKRVGNDRQITTLSEIKPGISYVIVDDLVRSGGTMNKVAQYLLKHGATAVDSLFAHCYLEYAPNMNIFRHIYTSDSCQAPREWVKIRVIDQVNQILRV